MGSGIGKTLAYSNAKWPLVELGEVCETASGGTPARGKASYYEAGKIPWLRSGEVSQGEIFRSELFITEEGLRNSSAKIFRSNTVLVAMYGATAGEVGILRFDACTNQAICGITPDNRLLPDFLYLLLKANKRLLIRLAGGGAQPNISQKIIRKICIPLPPLEVQREIVAEIEAYQKVIDGARVVVENYRPHIPIDPAWQIKELSEIAIKITDGTHTTPNYTASGIPFLRVTDITGSNTSKKFISEEEHRELIKRCHPQEGDVLYSKNGTIGVAKVIDWEGDFSIFVSLALIKPRRELVNSRYLECFLNSDTAYAQATSRSKSGTVTNLHLVDIKTIQVPLPTLTEQQQIVAEIEAERALVNANRELIERFEKKIQATVGRGWGG